MNRLIDNLLKRSRVEIGEYVSPLGSVDIAASICHIFDLLKAWQSQEVLN